MERLRVRDVHANLRGDGSVGLPKVVRSRSVTRAHGFMNVALPRVSKKLAGSRALTLGHPVYAHQAGHVLGGAGGLGVRQRAGRHRRRLGRHRGAAGAIGILGHFTTGTAESRGGGGKEGHGEVRMVILGGKLMIGAHGESSSRATRSSAGIGCWARPNRSEG